METTLNIHERLTLLGILPQKGGSFREALHTDSLRHKLLLTDEEVERSGFKQTDGIAKWDDDIPTDFELTEGELDVIGIAFATLEQREAVPTNTLFLALYKKFQETVDSVLKELNGNNK